MGVNRSGDWDQADNPSARPQVPKVLWTMSGKRAWRSYMQLGGMTAECVATPTLALNLPGSDNNINRGTGAWAFSMDYKTHLGPWVFAQWLK